MTDPHQIKRTGARGMGRLILITLVFFWGALWASRLPAADEAPELAETPAIEMERTLVTGSRSEISDPSKMSVPVQVVTRRQIQEIGAVSLAQALEVIQGVEFIQSPDLNAAPGVQTLRMRGMDANQVLVLIDGRRQPGSRPDNQGFSFTDIGTISIDDVERIEVLRDGASAQYGSDAVAGVINLVLRKNIPRLSANTQYGLSARGDGEEMQGDVSGGLPIGKSCFANLSLFGKETGAYDRTAGTPRWTAPEIQQAGANLKFSWEVDYRQALDANLRYNGTETTFRKGMVGDIPQDRISKKTDHHASLNWEGEFRPARFEAGAGFSSSKTEYRHSEDPDYNGDLESELIDAFTHAHWRMFRGVDLFTGVSYLREDVDSPQRDFVESRDVGAIFAEARISPLEGLELQVSGRLEDYSDFGENFAPKVSARYKVFDGMLLRASVSRSFQVPTLYQLHDRFIGAMGWNDIYGNPDLDPAEGINLNMGAVWNPFPGRGVQLSVDLFQNRIDNFIETEVVSKKTPTKNAVTTYVNIPGTSTFEGVEATLAVPLPHGFQLDFTANYLEARKPNDDELTNRPRSSLNATLRYRFGERFLANLRYNYRGKYLSDKRPHKKIDPFDFLNAHLSYTLRDGVRIYLGARNLLDEKPPVNLAEYEAGHMESILDSAMGAYFYGGVRLNYR